MVHVVGQATLARPGCFSSPSFGYFLSESVLQKKSWEEKEEEEEESCLPHPPQVFISLSEPISNKDQIPRIRGTNQSAGLSGKRSPTPKRDGQCKWQQGESYTRFVATGSYWRTQAHWLVQPNTGSFRLVQVHIGQHRRSYKPTQVQLSGTTGATSCVSPTDTRTPNYTDLLLLWGETFREGGGAVHYAKVVEHYWSVQLSSQVNNGVCSQALWGPQRREKAKTRSNVRNV
ncbi:hypothetical protein Hamer_G019935 [Homarus americanus]|uniref:Uncharacterized protein n=1 Tax=Homarus americanus TaxID=6706 RepID=A0A8J5JU86_HOMAM|nr:hypothetical protein Hamer_G019935 [Homarus americanus]